MIVEEVRWDGKVKKYTYKRSRDIIMDKMLPQAFSEQLLENKM